MLEKSLLVAATALTVHYLPRLMRKRPQFAIHGSVSPGFDEIMKAFRENFTKGLDRRESGSAFAVYHRGKRVAHVFGGYADPDCHWLWKEDTLSIVFSVTKGISAICVAMLVDRGLIDYDHHVSKYWPEFAANGKKDITVQQLLEHKAGIPFCHEPLTYDLVSDIPRCGSVLASATPRWKLDGTLHGYHIITYGLLVAEIVRRVDPKGRTLGRFFADEIAEPFGIDFFIGLPLSENYRVAKLTVPKPGPGIALRSLGSSRNRQALKGAAKDASYWKEFFENSNDLIDMTKQNNPEFRRVEIPSMSGYGTADGIAKLFGILAAGGTDPILGKTLLSKTLVNSFMDSELETIDLVAKIPISFRRGMVIDYTEDGRKIYGHPGAGGPVAIADPDHQLGYAFTTRYSGPFALGDDPRFRNLQRALYKCVDNLKT